MVELPLPKPGQARAVAFVDVHLRHLVEGEVEASLRFEGGQSRAEAALAGFDVSGYAANRNEVYPQPSRGASALSPYIRHGLLSLRRVWDHVEHGPERDRDKFRDELMWQEYARHWYARLGPRSARGINHEIVGKPGPGWDRDMACMELTVDELEEDGWLVNQTRMWLASEWAVRRGLPWQEGEDHFFRHLLDGSRAANRLGWQWTIGTASKTPYGFSRWQVEKRAKSLCASCDMVHDCPIEDWPADPHVEPASTPVGLTKATERDLSGPSDVVGSTAGIDAVWLTAESLGFDDPALAAHPDLPAIFVFDEPLLASLRLSAKRLVFLVETLAEMGAHRPLEVWLGRPTAVLSGRSVAVTHAPVPGFVRRAKIIQPAETHPWPWLSAPTSGSVQSFRAWRKSVAVRQ